MTSIKRTPNGNYSIFSNGEYHVFDSTGKLIYRKPFRAKLTAPPLTAVQMADSRKWGFVNDTDSLIIPPIFNHVKRSSYQLSQMSYLFELQKDGRNGTIGSLENVQFFIIKSYICLTTASKCKPIIFGD